MGARPKRQQTDYPGVFFIYGRRLGTRKDENKTEKIFYCTWTEDGKTREAKAGRQYADRMTAAKANQKRIALQEGREIPKADERKLQKWSIKKLWKEYLKSKGADLKGIKTDQNRFDKHIIPVFKNKTPAEIDPLSIERFRRNLKKKVTPQTANNILELLRRIINFGINKQLTPGLSFRIQLEKVNSEKTEDLTPKQMTRLLKVLKKEKDRQAANLMLMALYTGMRRGELFKLKWEHVDFRNGFITLKDPKGGQDQRIPLNEMAKKVLKNHPQTESDYVFPGRDGKQRVDIKRPVNRIKEAAKLPSDFRPLHGLRHAYASMLASSGRVDMYTLQKLLTHKSPQMTQRYAHLRDSALRRAANVADDIFKNGEAS